MLRYELNVFTGHAKSKNDAVECKEGFYCPKGTPLGAEIPCDPGSYNPGKKAASVAKCKKCDKQKFCDSYGLSRPQGLCGDGFFCIIGSPFKKPVNATANYGPCPPGHYCKDGLSKPE